MWQSTGDRDPVSVVAAVIRRSDRYLLCRRPEGKRHAGLWEFPGGKLVGSETLERAARRELREELGVELVRTAEVLLRVRDPGSPFEIHFLPAEIDGTPRPLEHDRVEWFTRAELAELELAPADARFVRETLPAG